MFGRPLNEALYEQLQRQFGKVKIRSQGTEAYRSARMTITGLRVNYKHGERYSVNCPYCNDTRQRLQFSYLWGVWLPEDGHKHLDLLMCFNEHCEMRPGCSWALYQTLYETLPSQRRRVGRRDLQPGVPYSPPAHLDPPGAVVPLTGLPDNHPAVLYLRKRGYSMPQVAQLFQLGYCEEASERFPLMQGRIVVPIFSGGKYVGWQGRYTGDIDWKAYRTPKYYNSDQFTKSEYLYNYDTADAYKVVVLVEGVATVWALGPQFVASFGSSVSVSQAEAAAELGREGYVVLLLDGDTWRPNPRYGYIPAENSIRTLRSYLGDKLVVIQLPDGAKPDSYSVPQLWDILEQPLRRAGYLEPLTALKTRLPGASIKLRKICAT